MKDGLQLVEGLHLLVHEYVVDVSVEPKSDNSISNSSLRYTSRSDTFQA